MRARWHRRERGLAAIQAVRRSGQRSDLRPSIGSRADRSLKKFKSARTLVARRRPPGRTAVMTRSRGLVRMSPQRRLLVISTADGVVAKDVSIHAAAVSESLTRTR